MTTVEVLNDLLLDLKAREKSLISIQTDYAMKNDRENTSRIISKLSGYRLAVGLVELRRNDAMRDEVER